MKINLESLLASGDALRILERAFINDYEWSVNHSLPDQLIYYVPSTKKTAEYNHLAVVFNTLGVFAWKEGKLYPLFAEYEDFEFLVDTLRKHKIQEPFDFGEWLKSQGWKRHKSTGFGKARPKEYYIYRHKKSFGEFHCVDATYSYVDFYKQHTEVNFATQFEVENFFTIREIYFTNEE